MNPPLYKAAINAKKGDGNLGLKFDKFFDKWTKNEKNEWKVGGDQKQAFLKDYAGKKGDENSINIFHKRQSKLSQHANGMTEYFQATDAFITGMGNSHPVGNGMRWHHTLGVPYLPATGLKGMLRQWFELWEALKVNYPTR